MKECPVCGAIAFEDAATCYGCLHSFVEDETACSAREGDQSSAVCDAGGKGGLEGEGAPAVFTISVSPVVECGRTTWTCTVEPASRPAG